MNHLTKTITNQLPKPYDHYWSALSTHQIIELPHHKELHIYPNHITLFTYHPYQEYKTTKQTINNNDPTLLPTLQKWLNPPTPQKPTGSNKPPKTTPTSPN